MRYLSLFFLSLCGYFLLSCRTTPLPPPQTSLYVYRFHPPTLIEFSNDFQIAHEIPFSIPPNCAVFNLFSAPVGAFLAMELSCPNGQTVLLMDTESAAVTQPVTISDSHFLAWDLDGKGVYLKVDSLGNTRILRALTGGRQALIPISPLTYDLAPHPAASGFGFTFSGGLGQGSELWFAGRDGDGAAPLHAEPHHYISFARYSPDGSRLAWINVPDTPTPFTVGELWRMDVDGSNLRKLAQADAGHGYAPNWSPDSRQIAFVVRENAEEPGADHSSEALLSNIYLVDVESGMLTQVTELESGHVETPYWSPDGNTLAFNAVVDDRMDVHIANVVTGEIRPLTVEISCCPAWLQK